MKTMNRLYQEHQGKVSDKWSLYIQEYDRLFAPYHKNPVCLLEVGIQNGGSLEIWSKYFPLAIKIVGCDINPDCAKLQYEDNRIALVVSDINTDATEKQILEHSPLFDLIIDDGSHSSGDIIRMFARYFKHLKDNGLYVVEDLHCSYWQEFEGGLFYPFSSITFFKRLVDVANHEHWGVDKPCTDILKGFFSKYNFNMDEEILRQVHSVEFINSMAVIHKCVPESNILGSRFIAGTTESVLPGFLSSPGTITAPSQALNEWSLRSTPPDEELKAALSERDDVISSLEASIKEKDSQLQHIISDHGWRLLKKSRDWVLPLESKRRRVAKNVWHLIKKKIAKPIKQATIYTCKRLKLHKKIASLFGIMYWPEGLPEISQGFAGEELRAPLANKDIPLISVVMPVYNACRCNKKHFISALESIANQTYKNIELIIVDDGSTDESLKVCEAFLSTRPDLLVHYFTKKNGGQSSARNFGIKNCSGEYIGFIDQDDEWYKDKLEQVVTWLGDKRIDVLYTDADTINDEGYVIQKRIHQTCFAGWPHPKKVIEDILFKDVFVMPGLMTIKKETFEMIGGFDENLSGYEDDDLFLRLFEKSRIFYLPVPTLRWRMYGDNYSFSRRMLASRSYYWKKLLKNYTDNSTNQSREHMISLRFFWEFIFRALDQYDACNELYGRSIDGAREILPYLPKPQRLLFGFVFQLPIKYTMITFILARKARSLFS